MLLRNRQMVKWCEHGWKYWIIIGYIWLLYVIIHNYINPIIGFICSIDRVLLLLAVSIAARGVLSVQLIEFHLFWGRQKRYPKNSKDRFQLLIVQRPNGVLDNHHFSELLFLIHGGWSDLYTVRCIGKYVSQHEETSCTKSQHDNSKEWPSNEARFPCWTCVSTLNEAFHGRTQLWMMRTWTGAVLM